MSTDRDTTRIVRSWLRTDEHESADRVLDAVLDRLDTTPQRRATWWPARRFPEMNNTAKLALGELAVVVIALLGIGFLLPGGPSIGGPGPRPQSRHPRRVQSRSTGPTIGCSTQAPMSQLRSPNESDALHPHFPRRVARLHCTGPFIPAGEGH